MEEKTYFADSHYEFTTEVPEVTSNKDEFEEAFDLATKFGPFKKIPLVVYTAIAIFCAIMLDIAISTGSNMTAGGYVRLIMVDIVVYIVVMLLFYVLCLGISLIWVKIKK